jgi:hypothetical protein
MTLYNLYDELGKILKEDPMKANDEVFFYECGDFYPITKVKLGDKAIKLGRK